ncbi:hypothetical protein ACN4EB_07860 [Corynebacterium macclintockiae]|uniref:Histone n=1 Tax=Corynebacterium jeikeium (strain K411) TaxID=306537 RepID=Q4JXH2_CORJK|nr:MULTISPECIES: hypothetical protein [Corynebacterium]MBC6795985.1 hypothetical protein [Corynebacterium sp. LK28]MDK8891440.1 hypothetical protein [Corynebacterium macclintockiae]OFM55199.1 hypothetical protein HMPREF2678_02275 [Corynebacterium sp. HMSC058E07]CAI36485.1 hypothetical protein jk0333 [Corynebacterium jeikeium K411]SUY83905.1 Uncharacterised protein [Corynebacterium jeikeium]
MPPKVTDNRSANNESLHAVEAETAQAAQRIVATYSEDFLDAATLMCMLGVEPEGLIHRRVVAELEEAEQEAKKSTRKTTKKAAKKSAKKSTKKSTAKKTTKKAAKKAAKKTTKKAAKKTTKKAAKKATKASE